MPLLLEKIRDSGTPDSEGTRSQALKCAGSIGLSSCYHYYSLLINVFAAAVSGADLFRRDADTLAELLSQIQGMRHYVLHCRSRRPQFTMKEVLRSHAMTFQS